MDPSWLRIAGTLSLYVYLIVVAGSLIALMAGGKHRRSDSADVKPRPATWSTRLVRLWVEYFGNTGADDHAHARSSGARDRRRNLEARFLMDYIKEELTGRGATSNESEELLEGLRRAMRSEGQG